MKFCDLHCHSNFSDGSNTPEEVIDLACQAGLSAIALTDHNTLDGLADFFQAAQGRIEACGGCEFTTEDNGQELHLLGLFLDPDRAQVLQEELTAQLIRKEASNRATIENLAAAGYDLSYQEFVSLYGNSVKNRVHIARYLIHKGIISEVGEAFADLLSKDGTYYIESAKLDFYKMIPLIKEAGGVTVWAHPLFHVDRQECERIMIKAKACGLDGVEVYYSTYTEDDTVYMRELAAKYGLLESGGSDFHGENKADIQIGSGRGNLSISYDCYEKLKEVAQKRK